MEQPKILIVDDDQDILATIRFRFEREGFEVLTAQDGYEALGAIRATEPDLVILDVMLPKENGYRVAHMVKEDAGAGLRKPTRVILLTARDLSTDPDREQQFMEFSHADAVVYKPFEMDELVARSRALLNRESETPARTAA